MSEKAAIYLDSNAGAPLKPAVIEALRVFLSDQNHLVPNPSSIHSFGRKGKRALAEARESVAGSLGTRVDPEQLIFTSSGSEANQMAIRSALEPSLQKGEPVHWVTTAVEHDSNRQMIQWVQSRGGRVSELEVNSDGVPRVELLDGILASGVTLLSILWVNNETGAITPMDQVMSLARKHNVPVHVDAAQAWGKIPVDVTRLGAQWVSFSGHKIGAFAGTGVLWVGRGVKVQNTVLGKQEKGRRGGTENLIGIISLGAAARTLDPEKWSQKVGPIRDRLEKKLCETISGCQVHAQNAMRVANTSNLSFDGIEGDSMVMALDLAGFAVSSGSACASGVLEPSHVLLAMGKTKRQAMAAVRVSLADEMPWDDLEKFIFAMDETVRRLRRVRQSTSDSQASRI